jgi:hypothetical protein
MHDIDEYLGLSEDPELAFVEHEKMLRYQLWKEISNSDSLSYDRDQKIQYCSKLIAFHDAHAFKFLNRPMLSRKSDEFDEIFDQFSDDVVYWTTQIKVRQAQRLRPISTILSLTPDIRAQIHSYINKIREAVEPIELTPDKRDSIFRKINLLAAEIDCDRSKAEAIMALSLEFASTGGRAAKELEPAKKIIDSITNLFGKAKELTDKALKLPPPTPRKQIEGPREQTPSSSEKRSIDLLDDEIPF